MSPKGEFPTDGLLTAAAAMREAVAADLAPLGVEPGQVLLRSGEVDGFRSPSLTGVLLNPGQVDRLTRLLGSKDEGGEGRYMVCVEGGEVAVSADPLRAIGRALALRDVEDPEASVVSVVVLPREGNPHPGLLVHVEGSLADEMLARLRDAGITARAEAEAEALSVDARDAVLNVAAWDHDSDLAWAEALDLLDA